MNFPFPKPRIPIPEFEAGRLPFIYKQFVDPCDAPITVWAQAFVPAFISALIMWYQVDLVQVLRTMWKPPIYGWRVRGGRHGAKGEKGKKGKIGRKFKDIATFDPNEHVGKLLNPFADEEMIMLLPGEVLFWTGIDVIVLAAFFYSIMDVGTAFLYEWTAAVSMSKYCQARDDAVLLASAPGYPLLGIFGWDAVGVLNADKLRNIEFFNGFGVEQNVGVGVVGLAFSFQNFGGGAGTPTIECRLNCTTGPRAGIYAQRLVGSGDNAAGSAGCTMDIQPGEVWIGEIRVNGAWHIIDPQLFVHVRGGLPQ